MKFSTFLDTLVDPTKKGKFYLTTQYELEEPAPVEDEDDGPGLDPVLPSPTHKLKNDFPLHPRVLGNLVLQQCNLWVGSSQEPKSSGLHHDFHDNLYMLLSGYKRFVLFPPSAYPFLHIRGEIADVHPNGLLVYGEAGCVRPDGLHELDAAHWRLAARAQRLAPQTKRARNEKNNDAFTAYKKARDELTTLRQRYNTNEEEQDEDEDDGPPLFDGASEAGSNFSATDGEDLLASLGEPPPEEPPSFSHIMPHTLHTHFGIAPAIPEPEEANKGVKPETNCPRPLIVELKPGQMLYLPASWFHEVTSSSSGENPHMALNYWMHPPDGIASTYADNEIWDHIRCRVERETDNP